MTVIELIQALQNLGIESYTKNIYFKTGNMAWPIVEIRGDQILDQKIIIMDWQKKKGDE